MVNSKARTMGTWCSCTRLASEQRLVDQAADELEAADALIAMMLGCMPVEARKALGHRIAVANLAGDTCITRKQERERVLQRLAVARAGRTGSLMQWPQETLLRGAVLADRTRDHLLSHDLAATASGISDFVDAATEVLRAMGAHSPELARLRDVALRFGASKQRIPAARAEAMAADQ